MTVVEAVCYLCRLPPDAVLAVQHEPGAKSWEHIDVEAPRLVRARADRPTTVIFTLLPSPGERERGK